MSANKTTPDPDEPKEPKNASAEEESKTRATKATRKDLPVELWDKYSNHKDSKTKFPIQIEDIKKWCIKNKTCFVCYRKSCRREINRAKSHRTKQKVTILCLKRSLAAVLQEDMKELFSQSQTETAASSEASQSPRQKSTTGSSREERSNKKTCKARRRNELRRTY